MTHLWFLFLLSVWYQTATQGFGINLIQIPEDDPLQIACTVALLEKYFHSGEDLSGAVLHMSITSAPTHLQTALMHALHTNTPYSWTLVVKNSQNQNTNEANVKHVLHEKPQCYFVVIENLQNEDMEEVFENWRINLNWNPLAQFVVYFSSVAETDNEMADIMIEILLDFMNKKIYNVNIIGQSEENKFYFGTTVFPYHPDNNCGNRAISIEMLDICRYKESESDNMNDDENGEEEEEEEKIEMEKAVGKDDLEFQNKGKEMYKNNKRDEIKFDAMNDKDHIEEDYYSKNSVNISDTLPIFKSNNFASKNTTSQYKTFGKSHPKLHIEEVHRALFLDKFPKDLSGCPLVAAFRPLEPYIFNEVMENNPLNLPTEIQENETSSYNFTYEEQNQSKEDTRETALAIHLNGIEYKLIQTIAERLHIGIEMQVENKNLYYLFQQLMDGDIEMVVGGIDEDPSISQFVSATIPYHQDDLTWCVAKAQNAFNFFNFLATYKIGVWLLTVLFVATASWCISITKRYLQIHYLHSNIYVVGIILGQAIRLQPVPISMKLSLGTLFFMGYMFSNVYQSFLISTLSTPKTLYQISHLKEIYQNRMHIRGSVEHVRYLYKEGEVYRYVREQFQMCLNIENCLQQAATNSKLAVVVSRQHFLYNPRIPRHRLYCFDRNENINNYLVTMLMPKKFHLLHKINPVIQHIIESGHMQKWARDLERRRKINEQIQHAREGQFKSLTLSQVIGSFVFVGVLLAFALWMFVMECMVYWLVVKLRTRLKLAKYIHKKLI